MSSKIKHVSTAISFIAAIAVSPVFAETPTKGGTLTVAIEKDSRGFDSVKAGILDASGGTVALAMEEPLLWRNQKTGKLEPNLALSWSESDDKKTYILKLRKGVKFHDGTEFTAKDAAHHINRILEPKNKSRSRAFITAIKGATVIDKYTIKYELKHPWMPFTGAMSSIAMIGLIPSHKAVEAGTQNRHPVGTGPFVFKSWSGDDRIVVERNPNYWNKDKIHLDRIVYRIMPDTQARFASLKSGEVDVIWTDRGSTILAAQKDPNLTVISKDGKGASINLLNASKPPLDDPRVRQALSHAWNQQAIINITWKQTKPFSEHPLGAQAGCESNYRGYDIDRAKKLIADYGKPVVVELIHTTTPRGRELGEVAQQLYKQIGVNLKLVPVDQNTLIKRVFKNDYMISGWRIADSNDVGAQLFGLSFSKSRYNLARYKSDDLDKVALAMRKADTPDKRAKFSCDLVRKIHDSGHMQYRGGNRYYVITRKNVKNVTIESLGRVRVSEAWKE